MSVRSRPEGAVFLTSESPFPAIGSSKIRDAHLVSLLAELMPVDIVYFENDDEPLGQPKLPDNSRLIPVNRAKTPIWKRAFDPLRPEVAHGYNLRMAETLEKHARPGKILWVSRLRMGQYIPLARSLGYRVILDEHKVETRALFSEAASSIRHWPEAILAAQCAYYEERFCNASDIVVATSDLDACKIKKMAPKAKLHVVPNCIDTPIYESVRRHEGQTLFFSGRLNHAPNIEGLSWFVKEVLPRLQATLGDQLPRIVIAGSNPTPQLVRMLAGSGIELHANPPSMLPFLAEAAVVFVPNHGGGDNSLKILEAMAAGRAVVSTGIGAEGLVLAPTYDIFIADQADKFTSAIVRLLRDPGLRTEIGEHAIRTISRSYDWSCIRPLISELFRTLLPVVQE